MLSGYVYSCMIVTAFPGLGICLWLFQQLLHVPQLMKFIYGYKDAFQSLHLFCLANSLGQWQPLQLWVEYGAVMGCLNQHLLLSAAVALVYTCSVITVHFQILLFINWNCILNEVLIWASLSRDLRKYRKYKLVTFVLSMTQIPLIIPGVLQKISWMVLIP